MLACMVAVTLTCRGGGNGRYFIVTGGFIVVFALHTQYDTTRRRCNSAAQGKSGNERGTVPSSILLLPSPSITHRIGEPWWRSMVSFLRRRSLCHHTIIVHRMRHLHPPTSNVPCSMFHVSEPDLTCMHPAPCTLPNHLHFTPSQCQFR